MTKHMTREDRREQILESAITCFSKKGYHETTMDDIVVVAGLSKGSLYWHFKNKQELFTRLVETWFTEIEERVSEILTAGMPAKASLVAILESIQESAGARPELVRAMLEYYTMALRDDALRAWMHEAYSANAEMLSALIEKGIEQGEFRKVNSQAVSRILLAYMDGILLHQDLLTMERNPLNFDELTTSVVALLEK